MEHIYEYMDSNPEFAPRILPTEPRNIALSYVGAIFGGALDFDVGGLRMGGSADNEDAAAIIYTGGDDDYEIAIDDSISASTVEPGVLEMVGGKCSLEDFEENDLNIGDMIVMGGEVLDDEDLNIGETNDDKGEDLNISDMFVAGGEDIDISDFLGLEAVGRQRE